MYFIRAITFKCVTGSVSCLSDWQFTQTHDIRMTEKMASLKYYIIIIATSLFLCSFTIQNISDPWFDRNLPLLTIKTRRKSRTLETAPKLYFVKTKMNQS